MKARPARTFIHFSSWQTLMLTWDSKFLARHQTPGASRVAILTANAALYFGLYTRSPLVSKPCLKLSTVRAQGFVEEKLCETCATQGLNKRTSSVQCTHKSFSTSTDGAIWVSTRLRRTTMDNPTVIQLPARHPSPVGPQQRSSRCKGTLSQGFGYCPYPVQCIFGAN